jgi:hypothetical protein
MIDIAHVCTDCSAEKFIGAEGCLSTTSSRCQVPGGFEGSPRADCLGANYRNKKLRRVEATQRGSMQESEGCSEIRVTMH